MVIDNCPAHKICAELSNITIRFLPKNTTAVLQPLDAGIIHSFKSNYKKLLVEKVINDKVRPTDLNFNQIISLIADSWNKVKTESIINCFKHCHL